jgi:hypothetical protein
VDEGRKWTETGSGWRQEVNGGRKWMEAGSGWRQEVASRGYMIDH